MSSFSKAPPLPGTFSDCSSWGQDGGTLASVCESPAVDVVVLAFLNVFFGTGGQPEINFSSACNGPYFEGTSLLQCSQIAYHLPARTLNCGCGC
jgi:chitinase